MFSRSATGATMRSIVALALLVPSTSSYTWPDKRVDLLESILYQQSGFRQYGLAGAVVPCNNNANTLETGRDDSAEWFRTAYHDMATADVIAGTGGMDASVGFETERAENKGGAINESLAFFIGFTSPRSSMADIIAIAAQLSVGSCSDGKVDIPYRGGRVDALEAGVAGVPTPEQPLETHKTIFERQGFAATEMIGLVACGHTLGGVHGEFFPEIVPELNDPENNSSRHNFDASFDKFDNSVAKQFVANETQNPLAFGHNETTRSDFRIFTSDGGEMIGKMAESEEFFFETCTNLLERMLNTVPKGVELTDVITPIPIKPHALNAEVNSNGTMTVSGEVRIMEDGTTSSSRKVLVHASDRNGTAFPEPITASTIDGYQVTGLYGNMPNFTTYTFSATIPAAQGISSFNVELQDGDTNTLEKNGGSGFPFSDAIVPHAPGTCYGLSFADTDDGSFSNNTIHVTAAVRDDLQADEVNLVIPQPINMVGTFAARFEDKTIQMTKSQELNNTGYTLYEASYSFLVRDVGPMKMFDLVASGPSGTVSNEFFKWNDFSYCQV
ncbi:heme peroxidase [Xylariomycetidae sp. FL0641]|nr:heme peroxidase [Xylariomycetidae sp. FL0641]